MKDFLSKNGFHLSPNSKLGIWALLTLIFGLIAFRYLLPGFVSNPSDEENRLLATNWEQFKKQSLSPASDTNPVLNDANNGYQQNVLFEFNPNTVSKEELIKLGLPLKTVFTWLHYVEKGGHFYKREDLKKLYTLSDKDYQRISPYVVLPGEIAHPVSRIAPSNLHTYKATRIIDLNIADTADLKSLPGIGSVLAERIIAFRNALGGFYSIDQLKEVYHLPDSTFDKIAARISVNSSDVKKININQATYQDLSRHPYLRPFAKAILQERKKRGTFRSLDQLQQIPLINEQKYRKIAPYLTI